ncbi:NADPH-dependent FMN reductase [Pendulispora albinea]|uniref:NAD(P)H-dependent oxidoreductase n=1 Tax=Pendulispora albinea TaxID=2741071 RepID=A0ABZ2LSL5_9BACT
MSTNFRVLGIAGSLRKASYNRALLRAASELAPSGLTIEMVEIGNIPFYDGDVEAQGLPASVQELRERILAADGLLFATPEYNYSIPGVLKNAIDWFSRPPSPPSDRKPVGIIGASGGNGGTMRAQYHLRQVGVMLNWRTFNKPEVFIARAQDKFDAEGKLTDEATRKVLAQHLQEFYDWIALLKK